MYIISDIVKVRTASAILHDTVALSSLIFQYFFETFRGFVSRYADFILSMMQASGRLDARRYVIFFAA
ncbi:hypothetical protein AYO42_06415 [Rhizomicrobium sp. SCGC AG-212-E05]|nr:hypothetical protein AYO42_06415 [Rhizomicrobium sp. SCGC AG-212-E05]